MPHIVLEFDRKSTQKFIYQHRFLSHKDRETFQDKKTESLGALGFLNICRDAGYYTLISTSTPLGSSSFIRASTVFAVEL